jgi:hypothetical protein
MKLIKTTNATLIALGLTGEQDRKTLKSLIEPFTTNSESFIYKLQTKYLQKGKTGLILNDKGIMIAQKYIKEYREREISKYQRHEFLMLQGSIAVLINLYEEELDSIYREKALSTELIPDITIQTTKGRIFIESDTGTEISQVIDAKSLKYKPFINENDLIILLTDKIELYKSLNLPDYFQLIPTNSIDQIKTLLEGRNKSPTKTLPEANLEKKNIIPTNKLLTTSPDSIIAEEGRNSTSESSTTPTSSVPTKTLSPLTDAEAQAILDDPNLLEEYLRSI